MNISPLTVEELRKLGWNIMRVPEVMDRKSKDIEILTYARERLIFRSYIRGGLSLPNP
jgi:hypothetical protein